ncbi:MAG: KilA-N domain-containing protein [Nostoc sp.]|uniref:KilA-N domain-containing protein n=1 Tax=Nostoc sp. TaxID=1180 RepID=UPI002FEE6CE9
MNLVTHDWNGSAIAQLSEVTRIAKHDVPAGYVNATQMCKACNKQFNDYARLESTKEYWEGLSRFTGIPVDLLVMTNLKGRNDQRGTWAHPEIAIDLAKWVSVEFRIWANQTLRQVMTGHLSVTEAFAPAPPASCLLPSPTPTAQEISELFDLTLGGAGLDPKLIAGVKLNAIASYNPALLEAAEIAKSALSIPIEQGLVRPTQLGEKLEAKTGEKWSAIKVNKLLTDLGFQIPNPDGKNPAYLPTEKGKDYSQLVLDTAKGRDKTVQSLQWHLSVLEALEANDH